MSMSTWQVISILNLFSPVCWYAETLSSTMERYWDDLYPVRTLLWGRFSVRGKATLFRVVTLIIGSGRYCILLLPGLVSSIRKIISQYSFYRLERKRVDDGCQLLEVRLQSLLKRFSGYAQSGTYCDGTITLLPKSILHDSTGTDVCMMVGHDILGLVLCLLSLIVLPKLQPAEILRYILLLVGLTQSLEAFIIFERVNIQRGIVPIPRQSYSFRFDWFWGANVLGLFWCCGAGCSSWNVRSPDGIEGNTNQLPVITAELDDVLICGSVSKARNIPFLLQWAVKIRLSWSNAYLSTEDGGVSGTHDVVSKALQDHC